MENKYNELEMAKNLFLNGLSNQTNIYNELRLVATYMRRYLDYKPKELRLQMYGYSERYIVGYRREKYYPIINKAINQAIKKGSCLIEIKDVPIYQEELDLINSFELSPTYEHECRKLMFTILVKMKLNRAIFEIRNTDEEKTSSGLFFKGGQRKYNELKKQAKIPDKIRLNEDLFHSLYQDELVVPMYNGLIRFKFMEELNELELDKEVIRISQFDEIGWYYDYLMGDTKVKLCESCDKLIKIKSKTKPEKYCEKCAKEKELEKYARYNDKRKDATTCDSDINP